MKALILYRSYHGNTKTVAEAIGQELTAMGHEHIITDLRKRLPDSAGFDLVFMGAPTRLARVTRRALAALKQLQKRGFADKPLALFDTYGPVPTNKEELEKGKKWLFPGAVGIMERVARQRGLHVFNTTLRCEVTGINGPLAEHEAENAAAFARAFVSANRR